MQKNILIIGGTSGLGRRLAELYAADGFMVGIVGRRGKKLDDIHQQFPNHVRTLQADISDPDISPQIKSFIDTLGGIDILIVTASVIEFNTGLLAAPEIHTITTNVNGFVSVINVAWEHFKQRGGGQIVGVTSIAAARGNKAAPAYHGSKAFQSIYLESLRVKAKHEKNNITVTELIPGYMDTDMGKGERLFWIAPVDKAARQCRTAIQKKKRRSFITKRWWLFYHLTRLLPASIYDRMVNSKIKLQKK